MVALLEGAEDEEVVVSNKTLDLLSDVWAERGAS